MSVVLLASAKASPGVTTTAVALSACWPEDRDVLLVEADPDGGVLAARHGLAAEPGLSTLAVTARRAQAPEDLDRHVQRFDDGDVTALVAPPAAEQARRALDLAARPLAAMLPRLDGTDVLIDAGRLRPDSAALPLAEAADAVLLVARPRLDELQQLPGRLRALRPAIARIGVLLIGDRPYPPAEVAVALDTEVVAVLADDPRGAAALTGHGRAAPLGRSALMRSAAGTVETLCGWIQPPAEPALGAVDLAEATQPEAEAAR